MFDFKNLGDMAKIANQAKELQRQQDQRHQEQLTDRLYQQIGQLKVELDWLKKKSGLDD